MKMMIVILNDQDVDDVITRLVEKDFRVTRVASTGGFLRRGNTTLLLGVQDDRVDDAAVIIRSNCEEQLDTDGCRAMVFVLDVAKHMQI